VAPAAYLATRIHSRSGIAELIGAIAAGGVLYLAVLVVSGELGKKDLNIFKTVLQTKVYPAKPLEAADPA
jgi:hypothetical protein